MSRLLDLWREIRSIPCNSKPPWDRSGELPYLVTYVVSRIRRGGYLLVTWIGDHSPRHVHVHVHVYEDGTLIVKWDLENEVAMEGSASIRIKRIIAQLQKEGEL